VYRPIPARTPYPPHPRARCELIPTRNVRAVALALPTFSQKRVRCDACIGSSDTWRGRERGHQHSHTQTHHHYHHAPVHLRRSLMCRAVTCRTRCRSAWACQSLWDGPDRLLRRWTLCLRTSPLVGTGTKAPATVNTQATTTAATAATVVISSYCSMKLSHFI